MRRHGARWAEVLINYEGKDISKDIAPFLLLFTYTDNASDKADDISFSLEDRQRLSKSGVIPLASAMGI